MVGANVGWNRLVRGRTVQRGGETGTQKLDYLATTSTTCTGWLVVHAQRGESRTSRRYLV